MRLIVSLFLVLVTAFAIAADKPTLSIRDLKTLIVIYRGAPTDKSRLTDADVAGIKKGIDYARLFYFRNSKARLHINATYWVIDTQAPKNDGPTYDYITLDLKKRGVKDNQFDGILAIGVGFSGNWGGFRIFGRTGAAFGQAHPSTHLGWVPDLDETAWYDAGWIFTHEFQHAFDLVICEISGHPEMLHDHPYSDSAAPYFTWTHKAAQHWDWVGYTYEKFNGYDTLIGATNSYIKVVDADGDGMPDNDKRLMMDEKRFGSDPTKKDTDGDELNDLAEFTADRWRGSNPKIVDTDGDGFMDGLDQYPTMDINLSLFYAFAVPKIDGVMDKASRPASNVSADKGTQQNLLDVYSPLISSMYVTAVPELKDSKLYACWNEEGLYLFVTAKEPVSLDIQIDASADDGFWEGGDTYGFRADPDGKVTSVWPNRIQTDAKAVWGKDGLEVFIPADLGVGLWIEEANRGPHIGKPKPLGMTMLNGRNISINAMLIQNNKRALFTPNWSMFDTTLVKSSSDPSVPSLKYSKALWNTLNPEVVVTGTNPNDYVKIKLGNLVVGARFGDGNVILNERFIANAIGSQSAYVLIAEAGDKQSKPFVLTLDLMAEKPKAEKTANSLTITGEPNGTVDVIAGLPHLPMWKVTSVQLDSKGSGKLDNITQLSGFSAQFGVNMNWDDVKFTRLDPVIDFQWNDGKADPRTPSDGWTIQWNGYLNVPTDGDYTFYLTSDDGSRLYIDGKKVIDNWGQHGEELKMGIVKLKAGYCSIKVDYYEQDGWAMAKLEWSGPGVEKTTKLPVKPFLSGDKNQSLFLRQTDAAGNVSGFTEVDLYKSIQ